MPAKQPELGCRDQDLHPSRMPTEPSESESELTGERQPGDGGGPTNTFTMEKTRSADLEFGQLQYTSEADVSWTREARVGAQKEVVKCGVGGTAGDGWWACTADDCMYAGDVGPHTPRAVSTYLSAHSMLKTSSLWVGELGCTQPGTFHQHCILVCCCAVEVSLRSCAILCAGEHKTQNRCAFSAGRP